MGVISYNIFTATRVLYRYSQCHKFHLMWLKSFPWWLISKTFIQEAKLNNLNLTINVKSVSIIFISRLTNMKGLIRRYFRKCSWWEWSNFPGYLHLSLFWHDARVRSVTPLRRKILFATNSILKLISSIFYGFLTKLGRSVEICWFGVEDFKSIS